MSEIILKLDTAGVLRKSLKLNKHCYKKLETHFKSGGSNLTMLLYFFENLNISTLVNIFRDNVAKLQV